MQVGYLLGAAIGASVLVTVGTARADGADAKPGDKSDANGAPAAGAQEGRLPLSFAERPLTLPRFVLNPLAEFSVGRRPMLNDGPDAIFVNLGLSAAFGVTDDFQIEAVVAPLQLAPSLTYGQLAPLGEFGPSIGGTFRLLKGGFELGAHVDATLVTYSSLSGGILRPGIPARIHIGKTVRIDVGAYVPISVTSFGGSPSTTTVGLQVPVAFAVDITEPLHVGVNTGVRIDDLSDTAGTPPSIPLGVFGGYAIRGKNGPVLDIDPFFQWPTFATPSSATEKVAPGDFQVGVKVGGFFYL